MKFVIHYDKTADAHRFYLSGYLFNYVKILNIDLKDYFINLLSHFLKEDDNNSNITKSYINYAQAAKIIWCIWKKSKKHIQIPFIGIEIEIANENPALTALLFGIMNACIPAAIYLLDEKISISDYRILIVPNFDLEKMNIKILAEIKMDLVLLILIYIQIKRRIKKNDKFQSATSD